MQNDDKRSNEQRNAVTQFEAAQQSYKIVKEVEIAKLIMETQNAYPPPVIKHQLAPGWNIP